MELQKQDSQAYTPDGDWRISQLLLPDHPALGLLRRSLGRRINDWIKAVMKACWRTVI
jgi:hypothetical protein